MDSSLWPFLCSSWLPVGDVHQFCSFLVNEPEGLALDTRRQRGHPLMAEDDDAVAKDYGRSDRLCLRRPAQRSEGYIQMAK
ncbi:hypothetical protein N7488_009016 [Penicillium malachiteum]|nr:hypothetical protein N7488_009016 [Penicillium malachiteum]